MSAWLSEVPKLQVWASKLLFKEPEWVLKRGVLSLICPMTSIPCKIKNTSTTIKFD